MRVRFLGGESSLPGCWYSLSPCGHFRFNKNVDQLNHLLSRSGISVVGHHKRFREERGLFARDGLHLSRRRSFFLAKEIADHAAHLMVCFQSFHNAFTFLLHLTD